MMQANTNQKRCESKKDEALRIEEELCSIRDASRKIDDIMADAASDLRQRARQIEGFSQFWRGPGAVRYSNKSLETFQGDIKRLQGKAQSLSEDLRGSRSQLLKRQELLETQIKQARKEDKSDV